MRCFMEIQRKTISKVLVSSLKNSVMMFVRSALTDLVVPTLEEFDCVTLCLVAKLSSFGSNKFDYDLEFQLL